MRNFGIGTAILALAVGAAASGPAHAQSNQPIKFGLMAPMTGGGAVLGASMSTGLKQAVKDINESGGILGRKIEILIADDQGDPTIGVGEARRLSQVEKVDFVFGPFNSAITIPSLPIFTQAKVLQFSSTGAKEATAEAGPYHFSISADGDAQGIGYIDYAVDSAKVKRISILSDGTPLYLAAVEAAKTAAEKRGVTIIDITQFKPKDTDMTPQLLAMRRANPELLFVIGISPQDASYAIKSAQDIGWEVPIAVGLGAGAQAGAMLQVLPGDKMKGVVGQQFLGNTYCTGDAVGQGPVPKLLAKLKTELPDYNKYLVSVLVTAHDAAYTAKQAYEGAGTTDAVKAAAWIEQNADKIVAAQNKYSGSKTRHFLVGANSVTMAERPWETREDGLSKRVGC
jgi:ABC-type branched-subunit amino acid transport system substrate-binding protein